MIKIDFGIHIDGFPVLITHTTQIGKDDKNDKIIKACYSVLYNALKTIQIDNNNY